MFTIFVLFMSSIIVAADLYIKSTFKNQVLFCVSEVPKLRRLTKGIPLKVPYSFVGNHPWKKDRPVIKWAAEVSLKNDHFETESVANATKKWWLELTTKATQATSDLHRTWNQVSKGHNCLFCYTYYLIYNLLIIMEPWSNLIILFVICIFSNKLRHFKLLALIIWTIIFS
jgi:hypothetical protein